MITLRPFKTSDVDRLVELADNENVWRYLVPTFPYPYTREDAVWWIDTGAGRQNSVTRVIELDGTFGGWCRADAAD